MFLIARRGILFISLKISISSKEGGVSMKKLKIIITLIFFGIITQPRFCLTAIKLIQLKEILSIGTLSDDLIFFLTSVAVDEKGFIYLTDSMDYSIKKFDQKGMLIKKTGRKGQGPGEFLFPVIIEYCNGTVYIVDQNRPGIQVFDDNLNYKTHVSFNAPIFDLEVLNNGRIFVLSPLLSELPPILQINGNKSAILDSLMENPREGYWKSNGKFEIDSQGNIFFVASFEDNIAKFDKERKLIWKKTLLGGRMVKQKYSQAAKLTIPTEMIYKDIAFDKFGNIYILGGHVAEHRSRDVYVLDNNGNHLTTFMLQEPSHFLYIDNKNFLYSKAAEGTTLKKYSIEYVEK